MQDALRMQLGLLNESRRATRWLADGTGEGNDDDRSEKRGEGLPFVTQRRERENSAGGGRTGAMDLVGGTSSNPGMLRRVRTPNPRPNHRGVRCAEPVVAATASGNDGSRFHPYETKVVAPPLPLPSATASPHSTPALSLPHLLREGEMGTLSHFEALVRRFVRLGESTCSTASRVRSAVALLPSVVGEGEGWNLRLERILAPLLSRPRRRHQRRTSRAPEEIETLAPLCIS